MKLAIALLALIATPALAGIPSVPHSLRPYQECVHKLTGLPIPATPPRVVYSDEWSGPISPQGECCDEYGQLVFAASHTGFTPLVYSRYWPMARKIIIYRSARPEALIHEMAADALLQATGNRNPQAREAVGYDAEKRAEFECEGLE